MPIEAVFFDIDDTLTDRSSVVDICVHETWLRLLQHGVEMDEAVFSKGYRAYAARYLPHAEIMTQILRTEGHDDPALVDDLTTAYRRCMKQRLGLFDGAIEVLRQLSARYSMGAISNAPSDSQRQKIKNFGLDAYFQHTVISTEVGYQKPDKRIFDYALVHTKSRADETVYVGNDLELDVAGAKAAGWRAVWANMARSDELAPTADATVTSLRELPGTLQRLD